MKNDKTVTESPTPLVDSESRLLAYTTAAGLGAFFVGHNAEAQVVESPAFPSYPVTILAPPGGGGIYVTNGPNGFSGYYHYFAVDGGTNAEFAFTINNQLPPNATGGSQILDLVGTTPDNTVLTPTYSMPDTGGHTNNAYLVSFLGGTNISAATGSAPWYKPRLAVSYTVPYPPYLYNYLDSKYITTGALGFKFVGTADGLTHFGYMDVQVKTVKNSGGFIDIQSLVIKDMFYNATPNAPIAVPVLVNITNITLSAGNAVTINFTSNDNSPATAFTLETSPTIGPSATWTPDPSGTVSLVSAANPPFGLNVATYQAVTTATGGATQFYRIISTPQ
jgi:hypothetical protein